jgi:hypothetical protein
MAAKFRVEAFDDVTEESRGFISRETDENPNHQFEPREFDNMGEVREAIREVIDTLPEGEQVSFEVVDQGGNVKGVVYQLSESKSWAWELDEEA